MCYLFTGLITSLPTRFFAPALVLLPDCANKRFCPELSDSDWLRVGVQRCLQPQTSGRGFLQTLASFAPTLCPENSHFFESLKSQRRLALCLELNARLCARASRVLPDALAAFTCLAGFDSHAGDGHYHAHAAHDPVDSKGKKRAVGHRYARNLRSGIYMLSWCKTKKSFDEVKNKLGEKKAWATSATAKSMQAQFICLSVNLLQLIEHELGKEGIINQPEVKRRATRLEAARKQAQSQNAVLPKMSVMMQLVLATLYQRL
jgi:hypothetical protein